MAAGLITAFAAATWLTVVPSASAAPLCEQFGHVEVGGYVVQNNRWGTSSQQCIEVNGSGFVLTEQAGTSSTSGPPVSYPSIYAGCHYGVCGADKKLPAAIKDLGSLQSSVGVTYVPGIYDAAYDIWLDPMSNKNGVNATEIMIWLNRQGPIQPIGSPVGTQSLAGNNWDVWMGNNGQNEVVSYIAPGAMGSFGANLMEFVHDAVSRGKGSDDWFVNSVQFGFEPWEGGKGLAVNGFSVG
jgi:hypothetical protein